MTDQLATRDDAAPVDLDNIEAALTGGDYVTIEDPEVAERQIIERTLAAESVDAVLADDDTIGSKELVDVPLVIRGVKWQRSKKDGRLPIFAVIDAARLDTGEKVLVTTGAARIMAQVLKLQQLNALPQDVVIRKSDEPTEAGFYPLRLERPRS